MTSLASEKSSTRRSSFDSTSLLNFIRPQAPRLSPEEAGAEAADRIWAAVLARRKEESSKSPRPHNRRK